MKKYLLFSFILLAGLFSLGSCSDDKTDEIENIIPAEELPEKAQKFLYTYFHEYEIIKVEKETVQDLVIYDVELQDGYEVIFNAQGDWQEVDAPYGKTIPTGFIPEPILQTLNYSYNGYGIAEINTEGENYHIQLSNNQGGDSIELVFNQSGEIIYTSQN